MSLLSPSLQAFWAVTQAGTVLKAAKNIELTQTGVTQRIRGLEKQLGVTLFTRSRNGMLLTREGEALLHYVKNAKDLELDTLKGLGTKQQMAPPEISICVSPCLLKTRALSCIQALQQKTPLLKLKFTTASVEESVSRLKNTEAQIALIHAPPSSREIEMKRLQPVNFVFLSSSKWRRRTFNQILENQSFLLPMDLPSEIRGRILQNRFLAAPTITVPDCQSALEMTQKGIGFTLCPEELYKIFPDKKNLTVLESRQNLELPVSLLWYSRKAMPSYFKEVLAELSRQA